MATPHQRYIGVRQRHGDSWESEIRQPPSRTRIWLGKFETAEDAARAYDEAARLLCGPRARTNFPYNPYVPQPSSSKLLSPTLTAKLHRCYMASLTKQSTHEPQKAPSLHAITTNDVAGRDTQMGTGARLLEKKPLQESSEPNSMGKMNDAIEYIRNPQLSNVQEDKTKVTLNCPDRSISRLLNPVVQSECELILSNPTGSSLVTSDNEETSPLKGSIHESESHKSMDSKIIIEALKAKRKAGLIGQTGAATPESIAKRMRWVVSSQQGLPAKSKSTDSFVPTSKEGNTSVQAQINPKKILFPLDQTLEGPSIFDRPFTSTIGAPSNAEHLYRYLLSCARILSPEVVASVQELGERGTLDMAAISLTLGHHILMQHLDEMRASVGKASLWEAERVQKDVEIQQLRDQLVQVTTSFLSSVQAEKIARDLAEKRVKDLEAQITLAEETNLAQSTQIQELEDSCNEMAIYAIDTMVKVLRETYPEVDLAPVIQHLYTELGMSLPNVGASECTRGADKSVSGVRNEGH